MKRVHAALGAVLFAFGTAAAAQNWPTKPITFLNPFPAGGGTDTFARPIAARVSQTIGQQVIVENQGGAGGTVGAANVSKRAPDGYNWFFGAVHHTIAESLYTRLQYSLEKDFEPITVAAFVPNVVVVHPKHADKFKTLKDLIDYAKANPGRLNYGSAGSGTTHHLSVELFKTMTKTFMVHIPYRGAGPLMLDLLAGQVDLAFDGMGTSSTQIKAGKLIPLAITSVKRNPVLPNVPTVQEAGVPGYEVRTWYGLWALKGTPQPIKDRMWKEVVAAMDTPQLKQIWAEQGADPGGMSQAEMTKLVRSEIVKWSKVVKDAGAKVDN
ncbi:MAG TPA: tripartite tricarboxylate transporter substrate binding protein [Burkholderiales bacterium]|jgi:tripartite-type tricarboxylate transporter receptor subunit TctC|nr:tripartite tricarboxylate transporter substrate binding protein [Burkholderiales bacterium]